MLDWQGIFPEAHFVHIKRDGRDVILSIRENRLLQLGENIHGEAQNWMDRIKFTRYLSKNCSNHVEVWYEDLVTESDHILGQIYKFIDLPYEVEMRNYHQTAKERLDELATVHSGRC